jgi:hypothetical protein
LGGRLVVSAEAGEVAEDGLLLAFEVVYLEEQSLEDGLVHEAA